MLIGAQKAGTSWLDAMMRQHPEIFLPKTKELHFFNMRNRYEQGLDAFRACFEGYAGETAVGECTPAYLWVNDGPTQPDRAITFQQYPFLIRNIAEVIHRHYPELKLIVSLRNPVDRAVSSFLHAIRDRKFSPRSRILDVAGQQGILGMGFYASHLQEWLRYFPADRFLFLIYEEDIVEQKARTLRRVFQHLDVDPDFTPAQSDAVYNERSGDLFLYLNWYFPRLTPRALKRYRFVRHLPCPRIRVLPEERAKLAEIYQPDIEQLEVMLDRSLDVWRKPDRLARPVARTMRLSGSVTQLLLSGCELDLEMLWSFI